MYTVTMRRNSDNKVVSWDESFEWGEHSDYWWSEGNMGCDCNRFLLFERALGNKPKWNAHRCSEGEYTIIKIELPSKEIVYSESNAKEE